MTQHPRPSRHSRCESVSIFVTMSQASVIEDDIGSDIKLCTQALDLTMDVRNEDERKYKELRTQFEELERNYNKLKDVYEKELEISRTSQKMVKKMKGAERKETEVDVRDDVLKQKCKWLKKEIENEFCTRIEQLQVEMVNNNEQYKSQVESLKIQIEQQHREIEEKKKWKVEDEERIKLLETKLKSINEVTEKDIINTTKLKKDLEEKETELTKLKSKYEKLGKKLLEEMNNKEEIENLVKLKDTEAQVYKDGIKRNEKMITEKDEMISNMKVKMETIEKELIYKQSKLEEMNQKYEQYKISYKKCQGGK